MQCWPWVPMIAMSGVPTERGGVLGTVPERVKEPSTETPIAQMPASELDFPAIAQPVLSGEGRLAYALTDGAGSYGRVQRGAMLPFTMRSRCAESRDRSR